jgi:hypothetical protein
MLAKPPGDRLQGSGNSLPASAVDPACRLVFSGVALDYQVQLDRIRLQGIACKYLHVC